MKRIFLIFCCFFMLVSFSHANRHIITTTTYNSSQLIKRFQGEVYSVSFVATSSNGNYILYDAVAPTGGSGSDLSEIKAEGKEATSGNSHFQDYSRYPLEFTTGLYLSITDGYIVISYK